MTTTRTSKRSAAKTHRGLDSSPSRRTRSHTHRDRLCELLLTMDPAAIARAVKVLETYDQERHSLQSLAQWDQLVVKHLGSRCTSQGTSRSRSPATSRSSGRVNSSFVPAAFNTSSVFGTSIASNAPIAFNTSSPFGWNPPNNAPAAFKTSRNGSYVGSSDVCGNLGAFFASTEDMKRFNENVLIVKGDIGSITKIGDHKIDGIAFPTASNFQNSGAGAAAAVFRRAGNELSTHVQGFSYYLAGAARVTGGFGAGVDKLIHRVGPTASPPYRYEVLTTIYTHIMEAAQRENLTCLGVASISRGKHGVQCKEGARVALRAIQRFLSRGTWSGVVGITCNEEEVFDAFTQEKQAMLETFDSRSMWQAGRQLCAERFNP